LRIVCSWVEIVFTDFRHFERRQFQGWYLMPQRQLLLTTIFFPRRTGSIPKWAVMFIINVKLKCKIYLFLKNIDEQVLKFLTMLCLPICKQSDLLRKTKQNALRSIFCIDPPIVNWWWWNYQNRLFLGSVFSQTICCKIQISDGRGKIMTVTKEKKRLFSVFSFPEN
jgi:hypothetical protein